MIERFTVVHAVEVYDFQRFAGWARMGEYHNRDSANQRAQRFALHGFKVRVVQVPVPPVLSVEAVLRAREMREDVS